LEKSLGKNWAKRVLDPKDKLNVKGVKRLGVPGRQGTTIGLEVKCCGSAACKMYAIKVTRQGTSCGDGATGGMGFLKQARMQQLASKHGVTPPVDAVYCGHKKDVSFMVMPVLAHRLIDVYKKGSTLSEKHQKQLWDLYKILDTKVGIVHNDMNCLNIMIDGNDNLKLIDFDRSKVIEKKDIKRRGPYINLTFLELVNCFRMYGISPGENLVKNFLRIHGKNDDFLKKHGVTFKGASSFMGYVKPLRKPGVAAWCNKRSNCGMQFKMASEDECNICLEKIPKDDNNGKGRGCPAGVCKAKFCSLCIDKWLEKNPTCPICRGAETSANKKKRKKRKKKLAKVKNKSKELRSRLKRSALAVAALALGATAASFVPDKPLTSLASNLPPHFLDVPERHEVCFDANLQGGRFDDYHNYYEYANVADCRPDAEIATNPLHGRIYTYHPCRHSSYCFKMTDDGPICPICLEKIPSDDNGGQGSGCPKKDHNVRGCKEKFCSKHIDTWLETNPTCPVCRGPESPPNKETRMKRRPVRAAAAAGTGGPVPPYRPPWRRNQRRARIPFDALHPSDPSDRSRRRSQSPDRSRRRSQSPDQST